MKPLWPIVITYLILVSIAIPWYLQWFGDAATQPVLGLPRKYLVSLLGVIGMVMLTVWQMIQHRQKDADD